MSIFGIKKKHQDKLGLKQEIFNMRNQIFPEISTLNDRHKALQERVRDIYLNHRLLYNKVENIIDKETISIFAEAKGALHNDKVLSFGNGGRDIGVGYVMSFSGQILGIGLASKRTKGDVNVIIAVNGVEQQGYDISLNNLPRKHDNFETPLKVKAGDAIEFVCKNNNHTCENTVASLIIEIFI